MTLRIRFAMLARWPGAPLPKARRLGRVIISSAMLFTAGEAMAASAEPR